MKQLYHTRLLFFGFCWALAMLLASSVYGQVVILDPGFTNPPTVEIAGNNTACLGQQQTFYAYQRNDYSKADCDSGVYTWSTDDSYATVTPDAYDPSIVQINWSSSGRHNVYVSLNPCFLIADNSPSQGPGASFEVDVHDAPNQPTVSVIDGVTNNTTATGTTICEGREIELTVPANTDYTWSWSGSFITRQFNERSIYVKPLSTTTYTLTATPKSGSICPIPTTSFTVTVLPRPTAPIITGTTRLGDGTLTLQVSAPLSGGIYVWYLSQSDYLQHRPITTGVNADGSTFTTPSLSANTSYFVTVSSPDFCDTGSPTEVPVSILRVRISNTYRPITGPLALTLGSNIEFWATPSNAPSYTWRLGEQVVQQSSSSVYRATLPGIYSVEITYNNQPARSQDVTVTAPLANQTNNGQALTYTSTINVLQPGITNPDDIQTLATVNRQQVVTYVDGLNRPFQQVAVQASSGGGDVIAPVVYDQYGDISTEALPYTVRSEPKGRFDSNSTVSQVNFYSNTTDTYLAGDTKPNSTVTYEASPLGRVTSRTRPGQAQSTHPATISYQINSGTTGAQSVRIWQGLTSPGVYAAGELSIQAVTDEDQRKTEVFRDKLGRPVLQRKWNVTSGGTVYLDTYSVYDESGDLRYIIPPGAIEKMAFYSNWSAADPDFADRWLFQYTYDDLHRLATRKAPGAAAVYIVYDKFDRPILIQDGAHRSAGTWLFTKYDEQGRTAVEGLYSRPGVTQQQLQAEAVSVTQTGEFETRVAGGYTTGNTYPAVQDGVSSNALLAITLYDDYDLNQDGNADYAYRSQGLAAETEPVAFARTRGRITITRKRIVSSGNQLGQWLTAASFYDQYGNMIQRQSNSLLDNSTTLPNATTVVYRANGFVPQVVSTIKRQSTGTVFNQGEVVIKNRFTYLPNGKMEGVWQQNSLNNVIEPEIFLSRSTYNELGQLVEKNLHSRDGGTSFLQSEDFRYNLQGQLMHINNSALTNDYNTNNDDNDIFGMDIVREEGNSQGLGNVGRFDGGISAIRWKAHNAQVNNNPERERSYRFTYDGLGRLRDAEFAAKDAGGGWTQESGGYDEKNITYDVNGNILSLTRYTTRFNGYPKEIIDNLSYNYGPEGGNRLLGVHDNQNDARGLSNGVYGLRQYDDNGSLTQDPNKDVTYRYNLLNKVDQQAKHLGGTLTYDYDASGNVLRRTITAAAGGTATNKVLTYVDGFVFEASTSQNGLSWVPTPEGRALLLPANPSKFVYEYHLRDHLGNLRVAFRATPQEEALTLAMENPSQEDGDYPKFHNVYATQSTAGISYHGPNQSTGSFSAAVSSTSPGPYTRIPVSQGDQLKISLYYQTPNGVQYVPVRRSALKVESIPAAWALTPALIPTQSRTGASESGVRPSQVVPGLQLSISGLLSGLINKAKTKANGTEPIADETVQFRPQPVLQEQVFAYVELRLYNDQNQLVQKSQQVAQVVSGWNKLRFVATPDLSNLPSRNGYLEVQLLNDGPRPVYFDSLTIRHPKDGLLVSQENHYYPLGMALTGVAINSATQPQSSKQLFNGGSELQDDVTGDEGVYSTFYRNYDPTIGRFQGVDPLAAHTADWSPYQFALGNPISANDPTGAITWEDIFSAIEQLMAEDDDEGAGGGSDGTAGYSWSADGGAGRLFSDGAGGFYNEVTTVITHESQALTGGLDAQGLPASAGAGDYWTTTQTTRTSVSLTWYDNLYVHSYVYHDVISTFNDGFWRQPTDKDNIPSLSGGLTIEGLIASGVTYAIQNEKGLLSKSATIAGHVGTGFGIATLAATAVEVFNNDGKVDGGDVFKVLLAVGEIAFPEVAIAYTLVDIGFAAATGLSLTDRISSGVNNVLK